MSFNTFNEDLSRAYRNTGLLASDVWNYKKDETDFQKANLHLWLRCNEIEKRLDEEESEDEFSTSTEEVSRTVRDTIPLSRLASYGVYVYNEKRENMYVKDDGLAQYKPIHSTCYKSKPNGLEVWMLPEVEDQFKMLLTSDISSSRWPVFNPRERYIDQEPPAHPAHHITKANPCQWLSKNTWPDQLISHYPNLPCALQEAKKESLFNEDTSGPSYSEAELEEKLDEFPCPLYMIRTDEDLELHMKISCDTIRSLWDDLECSYDSSPPHFNLNAEVPEFLPSTFSFFVSEEQQQDCLNYAPSLQQYPSIYDTSYEAELFPYSNPRLVNDVFAQSDIESSTVNLEEEKIIYNTPVFLGPPASYFNIDYKEEDMNNYVQLPTSEQPSCFMVIPEQIEGPSNLLNVVATIPSYNLPTFNMRKPKEVLDYLEKQLSKIYNPRVDDLKTIYCASGKIGKTFDSVQQNYYLIQEAPCCRGQRPSQKPLYSDVLMNDAGSLSYSDSRYDELEKEAVEQYSGSDLIAPSSPHHAPLSPHHAPLSPHHASLSPHRAPISPHHASLSPHRAPISPHRETTYEAGTQNRTVYSETESISPDLSPPTSNKSKRRVRLVDFSPRRARCTSQSSQSSKYSTSPTPGSKRSSNISSLCQDSCIPNKQALWMENKRKKLERKKKLLTRNNKIQYNEQPVEFVENEILLISSLLDTGNKFLKEFFENEWKTVVAKLEPTAFKSFEECLKIISDSLHWFKSLTMSKELKKDFETNKRRLELTNSVLDVLSGSFGILQQYIFKCSQIKTAVPFDHRLFFDSNRHVCMQLATIDQVVDRRDNEQTYFTRQFVFDDMLSGKVSQQLGVDIDREFMNKCEWKLKPNHDRLQKKRDTCVRLINHERVFDLVLDIVNETTESNTSHNMLKLVDDFQIWSEWQWKFLDGFMFNSDYLHYNFNLLNKFNVRSLEYFTSFVRMIFFFKNWILYSTEAVFSNKRCSPKCQLLWNVDGFNLINTKTTSLKILLQEDQGWYFGVMWISKEPCNPWQPFCENSCCVSWDTSDKRNSGTVHEYSSQAKTFPGKTASSNVSKQKRDEMKTKRNTRIVNSTNLGRSPARKRSGLNKTIEEKIHLPEEKQQSLCILQ